MPSLVCIPKNVAMALKTRLKSGEITPAKLAKMTSKERNTYFKKFLGEDYAASVNALYESKRLLKDQQRGLVTWLETVSGLKPEAKRMLIDRVKNMKKFLSPGEKEDFLQDLAAQKLGVGVTRDEAGEIATYAKAYEEHLAEYKKLTEELRTPQKPNAVLPEDDPIRLKIGEARVKFENYVAELKRDANKRTIRDWRTTPLRSLGGQFSDIGGLAKSLKASLDLSFTLRQGFKAMIAHPDKWAKSVVDGFDMAFRQLWKKGTNDDIINALKAEIYGRENSLNGNYKKMGLDLGTVEEAYPTSLPEKVPLLGRVYKASETAFNGMAYRLRADIADELVRSLGRSGRDTTDKALLHSIGEYTNSLTGRGSLGRAEGFAKHFNNLFFSPKFFKSNLDFLTAHMADPNMDPALKKRALTNLLKTVVAVGAGLAFAKAINPDAVNFDATSSDFGKVKVGNTRVDVTAGLSSIINLFYRSADITARGATQGKLKLGEKKYDKNNPLGEIALSFTQNKLAPLPRTLGVDLAAGKDFNGNPVNLTSVDGLKNLGIDLMAPLPVSNFIELANDKESIGVILGTMLDGLGVGTNTYK